MDRRGERVAARLGTRGDRSRGRRGIRRSLRGHRRRVSLGDAAPRGGREEVGGCRVFAIPLPGPNAILGALLGIAMATGYEVTARMLSRRAAARDIEHVNAERLRR